jgi:hypothetical protein
MQADQGDHHPPAPPPRPSLTFGAMPSAGAALSRPRLVEFSYWLWLGACLVGVLTAATTLRYFGELQAAMLSLVEQQFPDETATNREDAAAVVVAGLIGAGVAIILVQMVFALVMHSGRGWARVALVLLSLLGMLYSGAVFSAAPAVSRAGLLSATLLVVIAAVPMFLPAARTWFAQQRLARSRGFDHSQRRR